LIIRGHFPKFSQTSEPSIPTASLRPQKIRLAAVVFGLLSEATAFCPQKIRFFVFSIAIGRNEHNPAAFWPHISRLSAEQRP